MPHYATKREAKLGDLVMIIPTSEWRAIGVVVSINANTEACNAQVLMLGRKYAAAGPWYSATSTWSECVNLGDCVPIDLEHFELIRHNTVHSGPPK